MIKVSRFVDDYSKSGSKVPPRWIILTGEEEFLRAEAKTAVQKAIGDEVDLFDYDWESELSGDEGRLTLFDELRTASLFGEPKIVVIRHASKFLKEQGKPIARFAAEEDPQAWVVFEDDSIVKRKTKKFTKPIQALVDAGAQIVDCGALYSSPFGFGKPVWDSDLSRWVVTRAKTLGKQITMEAAYVLHSRETSGLRAIAAQLDKIILSVGDATSIRIEDVQAQVGDEAEASVFEVVDQFAESNLRGTMSAVDRIFRQGIKNAKGKRSLDGAEISLRLLSMISTRMRELGKILELKRDGLGFDDACGQVIGRGRSFLFPKIRAQLNARTPKDIGQAVVDIERLDRDLKSGGGLPRDLFIFFILKNLQTSPVRQRHQRMGASS